MHSSSCITTRPYYVINVRLFEITDFDGTNLMTDEQQAVKMGPYPKALQAIFAVEKSLRSHVEEECKNKGIPHDPVSKEMREMKMEPEPDVDFHEELKFSVQVSYYYYILYPNTSCIYTHYNTVLHAAYEFSNNNDIKPIVTIYFWPQPSLATSKTAYKTLLGGLAHGDFNEYCSTALLPYEGVKHHNSTANPLHFFDYNSVIESWLTDDEKPPQAPEPVQEDK